MSQTTDPMKGKEPNAASKQKKSLLIPIFGIIFSVLLLLFAWWVSNRPTPTVSVETADKISQEEIDAFYNEQVSPALHEYQIRNKAAVERAVERITREVDSYKGGIPAFVEDITGWGTRFGVIGRGTRDLWDKWWGDDENERRVYKYVSKKFEKHLFSDAKLKNLVESSLIQFQDDLKANQNRLHADIKTAWSTGPFASKKLDIKEIVAQVQTRARNISTQMATDSLTVGVVALLGGFALEESVRRLVVSIVNGVAAYLATSSVATTATSASATSSFMAAGGTGGSAGGPLFTVIGVGAGLIVGIIFDLWMTDQLEKKLTAECEDMIEQVKAQLLVGSEGTQGMKSAFIESIRIFKTAEEEAIQAALREVAK